MPGSPDKFEYNSLVATESQRIFCSYCKKALEPGVGVLFVVVNGLTNIYCCTQHKQKADPDSKSTWGYIVSPETAQGINKLIRPKK